MTPEVYYRRAMWVPFAVPLIAVAAVLVMMTTNVRPAQAMRPIVDAAQFLALAGIFSLIPYGIFAGLVVSRGHTRTEAELRRLSWFAPSYIAGPFALAMGLIALPMAGPRGAFTVAWYLGIVALATGYFYALLINGVAKILQRVGFVDNSSDAASSPPASGLRV